MSLAKFISDRYFSVHLTTNIGDIKLSANVVYGRNGQISLLSEAEGARERLLKARGALRQDIRVKVTRCLV